MPQSSAKTAGSVSRTDTFAQFFKNIPEGVFIGTFCPTSNPKNPSKIKEKTLVANPYLRNIFGYQATIPEAEIQLFADSSFADPESRRAFLDQLIDQKSINDYLLRMRKVDGSLIWVEITASVTPLDKHGNVRIEALVRDVNDQKTFDEQSRNLYQQLVQAEKMATLGQAVSSVAHELNNPLTTILNWAERLVEHPLDKSAQRGAETIFSETKRAARIVRSLLTVARKRQSTRTTIDINEVINETLQLRSYEHKRKNIVITRETANTLPPVFADANQIQQVLLNLVVNAEDAMLATSNGGSIVIKSKYDIEQKSVVIELHDDGPGIPKEVTDKIFDPFFTTKDVGKGTGLGLTVARTLIQEHGGKIHVEAHPKNGTSFFIALPVTSITTTQKKPQASLVTKASRGATLLLVEDEQALAATVIEFLSDAGFQVTYVGNGKEALELTTVDCYEFDLIICDLKMPKMGGIDFYHAFKNKHNAIDDVPLETLFIFVTGTLADTKTERFLKETGCHWLAKPFRLADLLRIIQEVLDIKKPN